MKEIDEILELKVKGNHIFYRIFYFRWCDNINLFEFYWFLNETVDE